VIDKIKPAHVFTLNPWHEGDYRATGDHSYRIPLVAQAMLGHLRRRQLPARGTPAHHQCPYHTLPAEPVTLAHHQSHKALEEPATHVRLRDQTPRQGLASDALRAASLGTPHRHARPRMFGARGHCKDRRIVRWGRRGMIDWGLGGEVEGRRMGLGRAPRWSWPRWRLRSRASCGEYRQYRCLHHRCGVSAGGRSHRVR